MGRVVAGGIGVRKVVIRKERCPSVGNKGDKYYKSFAL
jgi:hypothetical protein